MVTDLLKCKVTSTHVAKLEEVHKNNIIFWDAGGWNNGTAVSSVLHAASEMLPRRKRGATEMQPKRNRGATEMQPRCNRGATEVASKGQWSNNYIDSLRKGQCDDAIQLNLLGLVIHLVILITYVLSNSYASNESYLGDNSMPKMAKSCLIRAGLFLP